MGFTILVRRHLYIDSYPDCMARNFPHTKLNTCVSITFPSDERTFVDHPYWCLWYFDNKILHFKVDFKLVFSGAFSHQSISWLYTDDTPNHYLILKLPWITQGRFRLTYNFAGVWPTNTFSEPTSKFKRVIAFWYPASIRHRKHIHVITSTYVSVLYCFYHRLQIPKWLR